MKDAARVVLELGMHQTCTENMESCIVSWKNGIECPGEIICTRKGENAGRPDELEYARFKRLDRREKIRVRNGL